MGANSHIRLVSSNGNDKFEFEAEGTAADNVSRNPESLMKVLGACHRRKEGSIMRWISLILTIADVVSRIIGLFMHNYYFPLENYGFQYF